jgi:hypothetical protein
MAQHDQPPTHGARHNRTASLGSSASHFLQSLKLSDAAQQPQLAAGGPPAAAAADGTLAHAHAQQHERGAHGSSVQLEPAAAAAAAAAAAGGGGHDFLAHKAGGFAPALPAVEEAAADHSGG